MPRVNPQILKWARESAGLSLEEAAKKLNMVDRNKTPNVEKLLALEKGVAEPTRPTLKKMAKIFHRPLLAFYLSKPPQKGDRGQDFRTLPDGASASEDHFLDALLRNVQARQQLLKDALEDDEGGETKVKIIASANVLAGEEVLAESIREWLTFYPEEFYSQGSPNDAFSFLRDRVEGCGVFVLLISNLGSYHTSIGVDVFRGFAIADPVAPFIVINDQDSKSAWSFTLLHEIAHLWLGQTGVSSRIGEIEIERFCNNVASRILLPPSEFEKFPVSAAQDFVALAESVNSFAEARNLSRTMVSYRLYVEGKISRDLWAKLRGEFFQLWQKSKNERKTAQRNQEGGPSYYTVKKHRVGSALVGLVSRMVRDGILTTSRAGKILDVKPMNVGTMIEGARPSSSFPNIREV